MTLCLKDECQVSSPGPSPKPPYITSTRPSCQACHPELCLAVINTRQHVSYPLRPCNQGEEGLEKNPSKPFRDLCLKLFSFVRGENNQMFLKVNPVNQGQCVGASRPLWQLCWVWFCTHSWLCTPTHTHPPPPFDFPTSYLASNQPQPLPQEVFPDYAHQDFPSGLVVKNSPSSAGDTGLLPSPGTKTPCVYRATKPTCHK